MLCDLHAAGEQIFVYGKTIYHFKIMFKEGGGKSEFFGKAVDRQRGGKMAPQVLFGVFHGAHDVGRQRLRSTDARIRRIALQKMQQFGELQAEVTDVPLFARRINIRKNASRTRVAANDAGYVFAQKFLSERRKVDA